MHAQYYYIVLNVITVDVRNVRNVQRARVGPGHMCERYYNNNIIMCTIEMKTNLISIATETKAAHACTRVKDRSKGKQIYKNKKRFV